MAFPLLLRWLLRLSLPNRDEREMKNFSAKDSPSPCMRAQLLQSRLTLCDPVDCSSLCSSVHGILQARTLEWPPPGDHPQPGIKTTSPAASALQADSLLLNLWGSPVLLRASLKSAVLKAEPLPVSESVLLTPSRTQLESSLITAPGLVYPFLNSMLLRVLAVYFGPSHGYWNTCSWITRLSS